MNKKLTKAVKFDDKKPRTDLLPAASLLEIAEVFGDCDA